MSTSQLLIQTGVTFLAASLGAIIGALLTRRLERFKHLQELRSEAYADFLRGFAQVGRAQIDRGKDERAQVEEWEGHKLVTDSRSRIAIYGNSEVVRALAGLIRHGTQTLTPEGMRAFAEMCSKMRAESGREGVLTEDIETVLFG